MKIQHNNRNVQKRENNNPGNYREIITIPNAEATYKSTTG